MIVAGVDWSRGMVPQGKPAPDPTRSERLHKENKLFWQRLAAKEVEPHWTGNPFKKVDSQ